VDGEKAIEHLYTTGECRICDLQLANC